MPKQDTSNNGFISTRHVARLLDCHISHVRRLVEQKKLPGKKIEGRWKVKREAVEAWLRTDGEILESRPAAVAAVDAGAGSAVCAEQVDAELDALGVR